MSMEDFRKSFWKKLGEAAAALAVTALFAVMAIIAQWVVPCIKALVEDPAYGRISFPISAGLAAAAAFLLVRNIQKYRRYEKHREAFGVLWDSRYHMRSKCCKRPLTVGSRDSSIFHCSKCDRKHPLRAANGDALTEKEARERLKNPGQV